jgi:micrococcal nuclease
MHESAAPTFGPTGQVQEATVVSVTDGDTIRVTFGGVEYPLRYIGIDAPETNDPNSPVEWFGGQATAVNAQLVGGHTVYLEKDVSETDSFGRLLRYVWLDRPAGWLLVNHELVRLGAAASIAYPPDTLYQMLFDAAQAGASAAGLGLWGAPPPTPIPTATPVPLVQPPANCDPSYPTVCIPPYPPDLDCGDISFRRFQVLPPDPHGFDGNQDGVGCESG